MYISPKRAILSDLNKELIELYKGIKNYPNKVWEIYCSFPKGKRTYYKIRDLDVTKKTLAFRAARTLYLNRTCFKGMWRHSKNGKFNVGYGGEDRRWAVKLQNIIKFSTLLNQAKLVVSDFEGIIRNANDGDFIFLDPPYKPGQKELMESHYTYAKFKFEDQVRLANILKNICKKKKVNWLMTNSAHSEICVLYKNFNIVRISKGTSNRIGIHTNDSKEILISNFLEKYNERVFRKSC